ncbi:MAG TPA: YXWGXW repeat-containing protein [Terracidiphilus sp.]
MRLFRSARWLMLALLVCLIPASSYAGVFISVGFAPPVLPVYVQPVCPEPGLMWTPGYWAYGPDGYFWVPGAWVPAPYVGALWTPGYWGWSGGMYVFHDGYWGRHIGYYGGVNYGFGYGGIGFAGGMWRGGVFAYNTAVMHVGAGFHSVYVDHAVVERGFVARDSHVAFSGGPGGIHHDPGAEERVAEHEQHQGPSAVQSQHAAAARSDKTSYAKNNGGHPANGGVSRPLGTEPRGASAGVHPGGAAGGTHAATAPHSTLTQGGAAGSRGESHATVPAAHTTQPHTMTTPHTTTPAGHATTPAAHATTPAAHATTAPKAAAATAPKSSPAGHKK